MILSIFDLNVLVNAIWRGQKINGKLLHAIWLEMHCCGQPSHPDIKSIHDHIDEKLAEGTVDVLN